MPHRRLNDVLVRECIDAFAPAPGSPGVMVLEAPHV